MTSFTSSLLSVGILLSSMFVTIGVMFVLLKHRDSTVKLPVDRDQLQRIPAFGLQQEIQDLQINLIASMLMGVLVVCLPFAVNSIQAHITVGKFPWMFAITSMLGLSYCGYKTWKNFSKLTKLRLGHTAEIATANELIGLQALGYQVFHDIQADGFNIDHLAIGKNGVFAIETKGRHKQHKDNKNGGKDFQLAYKDGRLHFPSWTETKPIEQATRQATWVSQWLTKATGQPIFASPVLAFPGWFVTSQTKPPFPILNHKQLVKTIPAVRTQTLTQQQVDAIVYQVAQRCLSKSEVGK
ncbi:nuclease-related domain-containing protein [Shewanella phaeophyticola]|uniref:NERD domain-containing protein n=1 Tax=Shewanella phaeophyticola TaxID=2978345 RepID=A0ABT2P4Q3_9GAMM|nr:nuclease-related domain-containing protein [Shewanella sp. KJ10-1]MCT8987646.1 NERD domain-containing protein [Shewanella sp. KJ10-1]